MRTISFVFAALLLSTLGSLCLGGENFDPHKVEATITGYSQNVAGRTVFYARVRNSSGKYLFVLGRWQDQGNNAEYDVESGFHVPQNAIRLVGVAGSVRVTRSGALLGPMIRNYSTQAMSSGWSYFVVPCGAIGADGRSLRGEDSFVSVEVPDEAILARENNMQAEEREVRMVFYLPLYSLKEQGTEMAKVGETQTNEVIIRIDTKGNIEVKSPARPTEGGRKWPNLKDTLAEP